MTYPKEIKFVTLSGPAGVGKTTLMKFFLAFSSFTTVESYTTRPKREGEKNADSKSEYVFISQKIFEDLVQKESFAWHVEYDGHRYGTLKKSLRDALIAKHISIMILIPETVAVLREQINALGGIYQKNVLSFFLIAPEKDLIGRMRGRGVSEESMSNRLSVVSSQTNKARELGLIQISNSDDEIPSCVFQKIQDYLLASPRE